MTVAKRTLGFIVFYLAILALVLVTHFFVLKRWGYDATHPKEATPTIIIPDQIVPPR